MKLRRDIRLDEIIMFMSKRAISQHTHPHRHTHAHIQWHTRALPAAVFMVPPALPQRTQQQQPDALPTQAATAQSAATVLSLSLPLSLSLCVRAWTIENDRDTVKNTKEHTHEHTREDDAHLAVLMYTCTHVLMYTCAKSVRARQSVNYLKSTGSRRERERRAAFDLRL